MIGAIRTNISCKRNAAFSPAGALQSICSNIVPTVPVGTHLRTLCVPYH